MIGTIFIKDPARRKDWVSHLNQPVIMDASGAYLRGPPRNYSEAKDLAFTILRSNSVTEEIDELDNPSAPVLSAEHIAALSSAGVDHRAVQPADAAKLAESLIAAIDPRKNLATKPGEVGPDGIERGPDGKPLYWRPPMSLCDCGTPDEGRHVRYKWPCAYYRNPDKEGGHEAQRGGGKGGRKG